MHLITILTNDLKEINILQKQGENEDISALIRKRYDLFSVESFELSPEEIMMYKKRHGLVNLTSKNLDNTISQLEPYERTKDTSGTV
jgi:hypothetical protein